MSQTTNPLPTGTVHEEVVSDAHHAPHRVIAIAVDSSEYSQHAFNWALDNIIRPETDEVVLLNVRPHVVLPMIVGVPVLDIGSKCLKSILIPR
jgi:hypothetical protein